MPLGMLFKLSYSIVNAFRYAIARSLYWKIKAILADFVRIRPNFRIRMKIPSRRRMHPSIVQVDPTPPGHPAEAREFVRVPATPCRRCRASLGGFQQPHAATIGSATCTTRPGTGRAPPLLLPKHPHRSRGQRRRRGTVYHTRRCLPHL